MNSREPSRLEVRCLSKHFGGITALCDISLVVGAGEIHGIIGPNGAGKTTLFNLITGIYQPTEGSIEVDGTSMVGLKPHRIAAFGVARTFQNIRLFSDLTVHRNIMTACQSRMSYGLLAGFFHTGAYKAQEREAEDRTEQILQRMQLWDLRDQTAGNLPYGMQRRLEIGRALALDPGLLLLDEPAAGMNEEESQQMAAFVKELRNDFPITVVIIDHHMDVIMDTCDRITVFNFGTKLAEGEPVQIQTNPAVIEAYLGVDT